MVKKACFADDTHTIKNEESDTLLLKNSHISKNVTLLLSMNAGDVLVQVCGLHALPELAKYVGEWEEATAGEGTRARSSTHAEALAHRASFKALAEEIGTASKALSLPLLEPLSTDRLSKVTKLVMGCLVASVSVATTQSILGHQHHAAAVAATAPASNSSPFQV